MAKSVFVLGMDITWNSARGDSAQLNVSRPLREINSEKFKRRTIGESGFIEASKCFLISWSTGI
ncbi:DUF1293 family protein, partial [Vibrio parahaemolyticus]|uniref:DUF1293 family protein n=1 Tax=Vibrio parahaemolyticus TaxID=670 RepID=UPI000AFF61E3